MNFAPRLRHTAILITVILFIASLTLYIVTLAPSVVTIFDDSLEFQLVTYQLGIAHPTGYPLYTVLGKLFTLIPVGNVAYRVNLMSAVFGAATIALTYVLILQMVSPRQGRPVAVLTSPMPGSLPAWPAHLGAIVGALLLAVGSVFWQQATVAEVYTLNAFFVAMLLLVVTFLPQLDPSTSLYGLAFLAGLSLTHHRTMVLLLPALAIYLLLTHNISELLRPKRLLLSGLFFVIPLLLYLYLPLRGHVGSLDGTYQNTWTGFWQQVTASGYGTFIFDNPFGQDRSFQFYIDLLADQLYTTMLGLIGLLYLFVIGQRKLLMLTGLAFVTYFIFNIFYNVADIDVFFIPNVLIWAAWSGVGAAFLLYTATGVKLAKNRSGNSRAVIDKENREDLPILAGSPPSIPPFGGEVGQFSPQWEELPVPVRIERDDIETANSSSKKQNKWFPILFVAGLLALFSLIIGQLSSTSLAVISQSYTWQVHDYGLDMLQQPALDEPSAIVGILGEMTLLRYFQQTLNRRPDIETVAADVEADRLAAVEKLLTEGKSVYLTRELPGTAKRRSLSAVGPLIRVNPAPQTARPDFLTPVKQVVTKEIMLLGYDVTRPPHTGQGLAPVRLTLFWQATNSVEVDLKVSVRLLNSTGEAVAVVDAVPVHFAYPTTAWRPDEIISDVYDLNLQADTPSGQYTALIIWYDPAQNAEEVGRIEVGPITLN